MSDFEEAVWRSIALSGTAHWMFDRVLIGFCPGLAGSASLSDALDILISRQVNDRASIEAIVNKTGRALTPERPALRPHPAFLGWHRKHCFKH